ncbi:hypothetical protein XBJ2_60070 [Xenorhabdus bovienii str. Jollieti]|uniref:Uncharacterized protein n=1 Tax=Xenorhabdus bovienii (strain SS-2004) TaxID=406818 RepID=D3UYJ3_XENBS|nr:hypothetical protein XBJ1_0220 [Xenorhabdus bovienii SS-2004]CDH30214.1 hypothetical protein XBJ2_60070 [Xenorhabdus bovienii str. Jollieti]
MMKDNYQLITKSYFMGMVIYLKSYF